MAESGKGPNILVTGEYKCKLYCKMRQKINGMLDG